MDDILSLFQILAVLGLVAAPAVLLGRWLAGSDGPTIASLFAVPLDPPWPQGVQEEEPVPWRPEAIQRRQGVVGRPTAAPDRGRTSGPAAGRGKLLQPSGTHLGRQ